MLTIMEQDELARKRIKTEIDRNFFVEAAAGSGKTTSLVDRMIAMVGAGIDVSKICAITFTKNAAKEFYGRFQEELMKISREETDEARRKLYAEALWNIDLCFMGTIDSFTDMLLHEHPLEAGIPSETATYPESDASAAYLAEYSRIKRGEYGEDLLAKYERFCAVQDKPDEAFARLIGTFTARQEADFVYSPPEDMDVNTRFTNWKYRLINTLDLLKAHPEYISDVKDAQSVYKELPKHRAILRTNWNDKIRNVLSTLEKLSKLRLGKDNKGQLLTPEMIEAELPDVFDPHENARGKLDYYYLNLTETDAYKTLKKLQYAATMDFLVSASKAISEAISRNGIMTFHDALITLRDLLRDDAANGGRLIRHIAKRHSYFLVDEFQDTDPLQAEIVFYLTAQAPQADWTACVPRPGALFIVGDPKQSIYRFRGADVGSFLRVRSLFAGGAGEVLTLSRNFRSTVRLQKKFNEMFPDMLTEIKDVQSGYHPIPIDESKEDTTFSGVFIYTCAVEKSGKSLADDAERVADIVRLLIGNPAIRLKDGKSPEFRDIMIITYRKTKMAGMAKRLSEAGIPVRVEGQINPADCPALCTAAALFTAAVSPTDAMSVHQALVSDAFRIRHEMIRDYCSIGGILSAYYENEEVFSQYPSIRDALASIRKFANASRHTDSAALLQMISDDTKLFATAGSQSLEYYCYVVELLRQKESAGKIVNHSDAAEFLHKNMTESEEERCVSLSPDDNRVHIANLHKVKGLQAPIVILARPYAKDFDPMLRMVHKADKAECRMFKLQYLTSDFKKITYAETDKFSTDWNDESACMTAERERLLYVAATRAENILIIGDSVKEDGNACDKNPWQAFLPYAEGNVFACIPENPAEIPVPDVLTDGDSLYEEAAERSVLADSDCAAPTYTIVRPSRIKLKPVAAEVAEDQPERESLNRNAALAGTLVHKLMECIVSGGIPADTNMLISSILREYDAENTVYTPLLQKVLETMTHGGYPQEGDAPTDLLAVLRQADEVYCEVPFCLHHGSEIVHGVIDLLYRCGNTWQIIDYKTNAERKQLAEKYAEQLVAYTEAIREIAGVEAVAGIYHIDV